MMNAQWTVADDIAAEFASDRATHPFTPIAAFLQAITNKPIDIDLALSAVTPESHHRWRNLTVWGQSLAGWRPLSRIESATGALDVVYVLLVEGDRPIPPVGSKMFTYFVTLVWWPELGGWRIHDIGSRSTPRALGNVRTSPNTTPRITRSDTVLLDATRRKRGMG